MYRTLFAIDLDRTLTKVSETSAVLGDVCRYFGINPNRLITAQQSAEATGGSFSELEYVISILPEDVTTADILRTYRECAKKHTLLYDDCNDLLACLRDNNFQVLIVTYGDPMLQKLKIECSGLDVYPYVILNHTIKGGLIQSWRNTAGVYQPHVATITDVDTVVLIDDKSKSFTNLPSDCSGYHVRRTEEPVLLSQKGDIPQNVQQVASLRDIIDIISV